MDEEYDIGISDDNISIIVKNLKIYKFQATKIWLIIKAKIKLNGRIKMIWLSQTIFLFQIFYILIVKLSD